MKFSVIIPCYNSARTISVCLKSVINQSYSPYEIILVDDCSSDQTVAIAANILRDASIKYKIVQKEKNSGPGISRNIGIEESSGDYIVFLDSDDWYELDFLSSATKIIEAKTIDIILTGYKKVYDNGKVVKVSLNKSLLTSNLNKKDILANSFDSLCTMVIKRELLQKIKLPVLYNGEDVAVVPLLLANSVYIEVLNQPTYNYFQRTDSLSQKPTRAVVTSLLESFSIIEDSIKEDFPEEVEFLGIKIILYGAILNATKAKFSYIEVIEIIDKFTSSYPDWKKNKYIRNLNVSKFIFIKSVANKWYFLIRLLSNVHAFFSN